MNLYDHRSSWKFNLSALLTAIGIGIIIVVIIILITEGCNL